MAEPLLRRERVEELVIAETEGGAVVGNGIQLESAHPAVHERRHHAREIRLGKRHAVVHRQHDQRHHECRCKQRQAPERRRIDGGQRERGHVGSCGQSCTRGLVPGMTSAD